MKTLKIYRNFYAMKNKLIVSSITFIVISFGLGTFYAQSLDAKYVRQQINKESRRHKVAMEKIYERRRQGGFSSKEEYKRAKKSEGKRHKKRIESLKALIKKQ